MQMRTTLNDSVIDQKKIPIVTLEGQKLFGKISNLNLLVYVQIYCSLATKYVISVFTTVGKMHIEF